MTAAIPDDARPCDDPAPLVEDLVEVLLQGRALIDALPDDDAYVAHPERLTASSLGAHYRHHIEHVQLLLAGLAGEGVIDYDARERDIDIQTSRQVALARTDECVAGLRALRADDFDRAVCVVCRSCVAGDSRPETASTLGRELIFLLSHAVHHFALMKLIAEAMGHATDDTFGVMPSTLADARARAELYRR
jgi:hypothetical protein